MNQKENSNNESKFWSYEWVRVEEEKKEQIDINQPRTLRSRKKN
jgi:hypothetical protein